MRKYFMRILGSCLLIPTAVVAAEPAPSWPSWPGKNANPPLPEARTGVLRAVNQQSMPVQAPITAMPITRISGTSTAPIAQPVALPSASPAFVPMPSPSGVRSPAYQNLQQAPMMIPQQVAPTTPTPVLSVPMTQQTPVQTVPIQSMPMQPQAVRQHAPVMPQGVQPVILETLPVTRLPAQAMPATSLYQPAFVPNPATLPRSPAITFPNYAGTSTAISAVQNVPEMLPNAPGQQYAPAQQAMPNTVFQQYPTSNGMISAVPMDGSCGPMGCAPMVACPTGCNAPKVWGGFELLLWKMRGMNVPPLVSRSPAGVPFEQAGVLGTPGASTLFGGNAINDDFGLGYRARVGMNFGCDGKYGIDIGGFWLEPRNDSATFSSAGFPTLARPFINANTGENFSQLVGFQRPNDPNLAPFLAGSVAVDTASNLWGIDPNFRINLACDPCKRLDLLIGYRYQQLSDRVTITENLTVTDADNLTPAPLGSRIIVRDNFETTNTFNGGQLGLAGEIKRGWLFFGFVGKIGIGTTQSETRIEGNTQTTFPDGTQSNLTGGLLAQRSNIGIYRQNQFSIIPEVTGTIGAQLTPHLRAYVGYNMMWWTNVLRAGDQIDLRVNPNLIPRTVANGTLTTGVNRPVFVPQARDFWVQGLNFGLELTY